MIMPKAFYGNKYVFEMDEPNLMEQILFTYQELNFTDFLKWASTWHLLFFIVFDMLVIRHFCYT